jgi:putative DNA primase/helicase
MPIISKKIKPFKPELAGNIVVSTATDEKPGNVIDFPVGPIDLTEDDVAEAFAVQNVGRLRFDHDAGRWYVWQGTHWEINKTELAFDWVRHFCRDVRKGHPRMASKKAAEGVEQMARRDQRLAVISDCWDTDPLLLGTPDGTVDLKTGELCKAKREDYITKVTRVAPDAKSTCPLFAKFLSDCTNGDKGVQRFLQQFAGYCLTSLTNEQVLLFIYGPGGNGKSVLQGVFADILGDYAATAAMHTFAASRQERHLTEIAMLRRARLVTSSETENGQQWNESRINQLTGGDLVSANFMYHDHFTFRPQFKIFMIGNHKPQLTTVNDAARRRFIIVPFLSKPDTPDPKLKQKLQAEYPAILHWMIEGYLDYQENGLIVPETVCKATNEYFDEQDLLGQWVQEKCECGPGKKASAAKLYESFKEFAQANGEDCGSMTSFGSMLSQRGFEKKKSGGIVYIGIALKPLNMPDFTTKL